MIVMKFGGTSLANDASLQRCVKHVAREVQNGKLVAVVVSAPAGETDRLVELTNSNQGFVESFEYDTILSAGEQVSAGVFCLALQRLGIKARSWLGWQLPIITNNHYSRASVESVDCSLLKQSIAQEVAVIAGFQGVTECRRITTLGRGGSDLTATLIASGLGASRCDIYTDVDGVYTADPRVESRAVRIPKICYEEMLEMASLGAKVLHPKSVEVAMKSNTLVAVRSSMDDPLAQQPDFSSENPITGTVVTQESDLMIKNIVSGIAYSLSDAKITLRNVPDKPGAAAKVFAPLAKAQLNVDMIVQNIFEDKGYTDITYTVPITEMKQAIEITKSNREMIGYKSFHSSEGVVKISIVGIGMKHHAGIAAQMFQLLADKGINLHLISTSEIKISVLVDLEYRELAVRALHEGFHLDQMYS